MPGTTAAPFATLGDLEPAARRVLNEAIWGYVQGGAESERTIAANRAALDRRSLVPTALAGFRSVDLSTTVLGRRVNAPFFVAPTAYQGIVHPDGEAGTARAAARLGVLAAFSTLSTHSLEAIASASGDAPRWFQLYLQPERAASDRLVERAERAGYSAIVLTVDAPVLAGRDRQIRSGFAWDTPVPIGNGPGVVSPARGPAANGAVFEFRPETATTWAMVRELRGITRLPIVVKGILRPSDARRAVAAGAAGVVVSNHGGRQLDGAVATADALPGVVAEVGTEAEVYVDGGVRRGSDVLVARALGARAVGLGRPILWALAAGGAPGVERFLTMLQAELATDLMLAGVPSVDEIGADLLAAAPAAGRTHRPPRRARRPAGGPLRPERPRGGRGNHVRRR